MLDSLVNHYMEHFNDMPKDFVNTNSNSDEAKLKIIITYLAGMTDSYAINTANNI